MDTHPFRTICCALLALSIAPATAAPLHPWAEMAVLDLEAMHEAISRNHPGAVDGANKEFGAWHEAGYQQALAALPQVRSYAGYESVLRRYANGFQDAHLTVGFHLRQARLIWPGFLLKWQGDGLVVSDENQSDIPNGARLISCDGMSSLELMQQRVFPWHGNEALPAHRILFAPYALLEMRNPFLERPRECVFEIDGKPQKRSLGWRYILQSELESRIEAVTAGNMFAPGIRDYGNNGTWLALPGFRQDGEVADAMRAAIARLPDYRNRDVLVVDLRGNRGGSSWWTNEFLAALYGDAYARRLLRALKAEDEFEEHRVSSANLSWWQEILPRIGETHGQDSEIYQYASQLVEGLETAQANGEQLYRDRFRQGATGSDDIAANAEPLWRGQLYVLTDAGCVSACLDFMDGVLKAGAVHVGQPTSADTLYMEVRGEDLPSGNARLFHATKVIRNRMRGHNEYYEPVHAWSGDIADTFAIEGWLSRLHVQQKAGH